MYCVTNRSHGDLTSLLIPGKAIKLIALVGLIAFVALAMYVRVDSKNWNQSEVTVNAAGRGKPYFNLRDGRQMQVEYRGDQALANALRSGTAQPRALASADLGTNGTPDVVAGYSYNGMGIVTVQRGNPDAFAPKDESVFSRLQQGYNPDPLLPEAEVYQVPVPADLLQLGDFNQDNRIDVLVAAKGGALFLLAGDEEGRLGTPQQISLPGSVTALTAGQFKAADGSADVAVAVSGSGGASLLLYDGAEGGLAGEPVSYRLSSPASAVEFGEMDSDPFMDVAVASGSQIVIVHGWGRKLTVDPQSRVERIDIPFTAMGLAPGFFIWNREARKQLAAIGEDGTVRILQRGHVDTEPFSEEEIAQRARARMKQTRTDADVETLTGWQPGKGEAWTTEREVVTGNVVGTNAASQNLLARAHVSFSETDDLFVPISSERKLKILHQIDSTRGAAVESLTAGDIAEVNLDVTSAPAAMLALPQKLNGERSIVLLQTGTADPTIISQAPTAVITVDRFDDVAAATACTNAVANDCSLRGAVTFANLAINSGSTINLPAGTYTLNINGTGGCVNENAITGNTIGDLESNNPTTFTGAGSATTIIRQLGNGTGGGTSNGDRVICLNVPITIGALTWSFSGLTITGGRESSGIGGAGLVGGAKDNVLNLTNVVISNNRDTATANYSGGGLSITGGSLNITNCTIGGTSAPGVDRTNVNLANSAGTSGGGVGYSPGHPIPGTPGMGTMTLAGTTIQNNTAASIAAGGGGADLFTHNSGTGSVSITTSTFANNQAIGAANSGSGGGIIIESIGTTVATTAFNSNSATNRGGGIHVGGGSLALNGTSPSITFSGNTATNGGGSVFANSPTTLSGTNTTIGGDVVVATNGTWTNNAGSALSPTNFSVLGGTLTCNNSTINVSGDFAIGHEATKGGILNADSATFNLQGNLSVDLNNGGSGNLGQFNGSTSTFNFNGTGAQSISGPSSPAFNNLVVNKASGILTLGVNSSVTGNLTLTAGTFDLASFTANRTVAGGTLTVSNGTLLKIGGTNTLPSNFSTHSVGATSTIEYSGTNQSVATLNSAQNYGNLTISGSGTKTLLGALTIINNVTLTAGTLDVSAGNFGMNVGGNWTNNGGLFAARAGSTVTFNSAVAQAINGTAASQTFNGVTVNKGGNTLSVGGSTTTLTVGGPLTLTLGTFAAGTATTINVSGNWTQATGTTFTPGTGTVVFNGSSAQSIDGTLATKVYNNFTVSKTGGSTLSGAAGTTALDINGNLTLSTGNFTAGTAVNINVAGNWTAGLGTTFTPGTGLVTFDGAGAQSINGTALNQVFNNLTFTSGGSVSVGGSTTSMNINGSLTLANAGFNAGTLSAIVIAGDWTNNGVIFTPGSSTVTFNSITAAQAINGTAASQTFNGITVAKTAQTLSVGGNTGTLTLNGTMTLTSGTFAAGTASFINVGGDWTNNGGTFTPGSGTVTFIGGGAQNLNGTATTQTFNNFGVNKSGGTLTGGGSTTTLTLTGNMSIITGTFAAGTITTINAPGNWANSGTFTGGTSTVVLNGNGNTQTLSGNTTFNNLTINHTGAGNVTASGSTLAVSGLLRIQSGTFISSSTLTNVQIDSGTTLQSDGGTMAVSGNWTNNGGTFVPGTGTVNFNGAGAQAINGTVASQTFNNLSVNKASNTLSVGGSTTTLDINGNFTLGLGTLVAPASITLAGNFTQATGTVFTPGSGTVTFDGAADQTIDGTLATKTFNHLTMNKGGGILSGASGTTGLTLSGDLTLTAGNFTAGTASTINVAGNWTNNGGTFVPGSGTVNFNGSGAQAINGTVVTQGFNNLSINKAANTLSVGGSTTTLDINGNFTFSAGTFAAPASTLLAGNFTEATGTTFTPGAGTVTFDGSSDQSIDGTLANKTFNHLTMNKSGGALTGAGSTTTLSLAGNMTISTGTFAAGTITTINVPGDWANSGAFTGGASTVNLTGNNNTQTLSGSTTFNNLTINHTGTGGVTAVGSTLTVTGLFRVQSGSITSSSTFNNVQIDPGTTLAGTNGATMNVSGSWTNNGTFTPNNNIVNFNGANNTQTVSGASSIAFDNLMISHTGTGSVSLSADVTVNTLMTFVSGTVTTGANNVIIGASGVLNRTSGHVIGALKKIVVPASFTFHVGTASGYTPLTLGNASGGGTLTVRTNTPQQPSLNAAVSLHEYWTLTQAGSLTADMSYAYLAGDVFGNEAQYRIIAVTGASIAVLNNAAGCPPAGSPCVNPATHTATVNGLSNFGVGPTFTTDWTVAEPVPTAATATIGGRITTSGGAPIAGTVVNLAGTQTRKTITDASGNYRFDGVETNGFYTVTPSRSNFSFSPANRSFSQLSERTEASFAASALTEAANPLDTAEYFVRQQYLDMLGREPDEGGLNYWSDQILGCGSDAVCQHTWRRDVAAAFFIEAEFQRTGAYLYGLYKGALGRQPVYQEFTSDRRQVVDGPNLEALKQAFAESFVSRVEFVARYQNEATAEAFVDALLRNVSQGSGIDLSAERAGFITRYNSGTSVAQSRSLALRALTESAAFRQVEYNGAFVLSEYFGYLGRDPDAGGYAFWLDVLNNREPGNYRSMVCAFITSAEYQQRFSTIVSRSNRDCGQ